MRMRLLRAALLRHHQGAQELFCVFKQESWVAVIAEQQQTSTTTTYLCVTWVPNMVVTGKEIEQLKPWIKTTVKSVVGIDDATLVLAAVNCLERNLSKADTQGIYLKN